MISLQASCALEKALPPVTLLVGNDDAEKRRLVQFLVSHHGIHPSNHVWADKLDAAAARSAVTVAQQALPGRTRLLVLRLDDSSELAQNILLRILEEPPDEVRFILLASTLDTVLATIVSRSQMFRVFPRGEQVTTDLGPGARTQVAAALRAAAGRDWGSLSRLSRDWGPQHSFDLTAWAAEATAGRWHEYSDQFAPGASRAHATRIWHIMRQAPGSPATGIAALQRTFLGEV